MMIFISAVLEWSSEKDSTNTCIMPTTDQIIMNSQLAYTNTNTTLARERIMRRQIHLFIGHKSTYGT